MTKACRTLAHLNPGKDNKVKDAVKTLTPLCTKARLSELIQINDDITNEIHDQGFRRSDLRHEERMTIWQSRL